MVIIHLIKNRYNPQNEFLFNDENGQQGTAMTYDKYRGRFKKIMKKLNMNNQISQNAVTLVAVHTHTHTHM